MKMKKPTKTKAVKAVKYWKSAGGSYLYPDKKAAQYFSGFQAPTVKPVAVLPMDADSVDNLINQVSREIFLGSLVSKEIAGTIACAALAAIGIKGGAK